MNMRHGVIRKKITMGKNKELQSPIALTSFLLHSNFTLLSLMTLAMDYI